MAAEGGIRELKRGSGRNMTKMNSPKVLWDDCLELEAYIRPNMFLDIFELYRMNPDTKISGETSDITIFCRFGWYQWVYFRDTYVTVPRYKLVLVRYCGPSIDVGPVLTAKIMRKNGQQVHRYKYRELTSYESVNPDDIKASDDFDTDIGEKLGHKASAKYFESYLEIVTPTLDRYKDDKEKKTHMPEVDGITTEAMDNYIGAEIIISHGDTVAQGSVRRRKRDVEGNTIGRSNRNTILDT